MSSQFADHRTLCPTTRQDARRRLLARVVAILPSTRIGPKRTSESPTVRRSREERAWYVLPEEWVFVSEPGMRILPSPTAHRGCSVGPLLVSSRSASCVVMSRSVLPTTELTGSRSRSVEELPLAGHLEGASHVRGYARGRHLQCSSRTRRPGDSAGHFLRQCLKGHQFLQ